MNGIREFLVSKHDLASEDLQRTLDVAEAEKAAHLEVMQYKWGLQEEDKEIAAAAAEARMAENMALMLGAKNAASAVGGMLAQIAESKAAEYTIKAAGEVAESIAAFAPPVVDVVGGIMHAAAATKFGIAAALAGRKGKGGGGGGRGATAARPRGRPTAPPAERSSQKGGGDTIININAPQERPERVGWSTVRALNSFGEFNTGATISDRLLGD